MPARTRQQASSAQSSSAQSATDLSGKVFSFSGFRDASLEKKITDLNGQVAASLNNSVTDLIVKDKNKVTEKIQKAIDRGVDIKTREEFEEELESASQTAGATKKKRAKPEPEPAAEPTSGTRKRAKTATAAPVAAPSPPSTPPKAATKSKAKAKAKAPAAVPAASATVTKQLGTVDPQAETLLSIGKGTKLSIAIENGEVYDVELAQVDVKSNTDKFYFIQLIIVEQTRKSSKYYLFTKWGRTGSKGQNQLNDFESFEEAKEAFEEKFKDKTKNDWSDVQNFKLVPGHYDLLKVNHAQKAVFQAGTGPQPVWEYYVDDNVDGKVNGYNTYALFCN